MNIEPENIPLDIIFEDENVIVLNKVQGMVVHPANGNYTGTLVQGLLYYVKNLSKNFNNELERPGIVHRLDKDTSGVIITAKNPETHEYLSNQFRDKTNEKFYLAIVRGYPPNDKYIYYQTSCR
jgi:23S rRNA pseudouridine1911/1915/1917 synthase